MNGDFDQPSATDLFQGLTPTNAFSQWITRIHAICIANRQSGPTSDRPTRLLWVGRRFFDTTLNKPVYLSAVSPNVWRDSNGLPV